MITFSGPRSAGKLLVYTHNLSTRVRQRQRAICPYLPQPSLSLSNILILHEVMLQRSAISDESMVRPFQAEHYIVSHHPCRHYDPQRTLSEATTQNVPPQSAWVRNLSPLKDGNTATAHTCYRAVIRGQGFHGTNRQVSTTACADVTNSHSSVSFTLVKRDWQSGNSRREILTNFFAQCVACEISWESNRLRGSPSRRPFRHVNPNFLGAIPRGLPQGWLKEQSPPGRTHPSGTFAVHRTRRAIASQLVPCSC